MSTTKAQSHFVIWVYIALAIAGTLAVPLAAAVPDSNEIAAVFPPWWNASEVFRAAASAGDPVRIGAFPSVVIVRGDRSVLAARLRVAGALILIDSRAFGGCETSEKATS